eukprot:2280013-Alexandrium_andersonii.AAC.1
MPTPRGVVFMSAQSSQMPQNDRHSGAQCVRRRVRSREDSGMSRHRLLCALLHPVCADAGFCRDGHLFSGWSFGRSGPLPNIGGCRQMAQPFANAENR